MDTKDDTKIASPITFHPMPKRFMVWDDEAIDWICVPGTERDVWDLVDLFTHKTGLMRHKFHMKIVQSTNLFDKDGKEIFEGSIVRRAWEVAGDGDDAPLFLVVWSPTRAEFAFKYGIFHNGAEQIIDKKALKDVVVVGHILSNPELLEEK